MLSKIAVAGWRSSPFLLVYSFAKQLSRLRRFNSDTADVDNFLQCIGWNQTSSPCEKPLQHAHADRGYQACNGGTKHASEPASS